MKKTQTLITSLLVTMLSSILFATPAMSRQKYETYGCDQLTNTEYKAAQEMRDKIARAINDEYVGWQIAIADDCQLAALSAGGTAIVEYNEAMTVAHRSTIGSIAKLVTAVAILKELDAQWISMNSEILPYLVLSNFNTEQYNANVTWAQLMNQTSGIKSNDGSGTTSELSMLEINQFLSTANNSGLFKYDNANAGFLSILAYALNLGIAPDPHFHPDSFSAKHFEGFVNGEVFNPIGIQAKCGASLDDPWPVALQYANAGLGGKLPDKKHTSETCGPGGWFLSAYDLLKFAVYLRHTNIFVSQDTLKIMDTRRLGWETPPFSQTVLVNNPQVRSKGGSRTGQSCLVDFRDGVEVVVLTNSDKKDAWWLCKTIVEARTDP